MRILACRDPATAFLRIRPTQEINTIFKAVIAALVSLWTISANAQTPTLEPAPYRPLPVGTTIWYDKQNATVMETDGMEMVLKLNGGSDWISLYGMFVRKGEWQYTTSSNNAFVSKIGGEALSALKQLWRSASVGLRDANYLKRISRKRAGRHGIRRPRTGRGRWWRRKLALRAGFHAGPQRQSGRDRRHATIRGDPATGHPGGETNARVFRSPEFGTGQQVDFCSSASKRRAEIDLLACSHPPKGTHLFSNPPAHTSGGAGDG